MLRQAPRRYKGVVMLLLIAAFACLAAGVGERKPLVLGDFALIDETAEFTSEAARREDERRVALASAQLRKELESRGLYRLVEAEKQTEGARVARCWVQKVSNLILNLNIEVRDSATGEALYTRSVDIRGNTDESWLRGVRRLVDHIEARDDHLR
ncbi:MAG TPA: DUF2380 domain-containing protein [Burkholderiales bacterium]|nr:DUF2380 domain-containing protein [Burkholderiales bacterium]